MKTLPLPMAVAILFSSAAAHAQVGGVVSGTISDLAVSITDASGNTRAVSGFEPSWIASHANRPAEIDYAQDVYVGELLPTSAGQLWPTAGSVSTDRGLSTVTVGHNAITTRVSNQGLSWSGLYSDGAFTDRTEILEQVQADGSVATVQRDHWFQWNYMSKGALVGAIDFGAAGFQTGVPVSIQAGETLSVATNFSVDASMSATDVQGQMALLRDLVGTREGRTFSNDAYMSVQLSVGNSYDLPVSVSSPVCDGANPSVVCDALYSGSVGMYMVLKDDGTWAIAGDQDLGIPQHNSFTAPVRFSIFNNTEDAQEVTVGGSMSVHLGMVVGYSDQWTQDTILSVTPPAPIPEPSSWALVAMGLAGLGVRRRMNRKH